MSMRGDDAPDISLASAIESALLAHRFRLTRELDLQLGIAEVLSRVGVAFEREVRLGDAGTIDFLAAGGLGIEVKIDGSLADVTRQVHRYAQRPEIVSLMLVTTMMRHRALPASFADKPIRVVHLIGGAL
jgi:hypothetical protein